MPARTFQWTALAQLLIGGCAVLFGALRPARSCTGTVRAFDVFRTFDAFGSAADDTDAIADG